MQGSGARGLGLGCVCHWHPGWVRAKDIAVDPANPLTPARFRCPRSREYSRLKMRQHRAWQADLSGKLKLKQAALAALPDHLRAAAEVPDLSLFPLNRNVWRETPPAEAKVVKAAAHTSRTRNIGTKRQG